MQLQALSQEFITSRSSQELTRLPGEEQVSNRKASNFAAETSAALSAMSHELRNRLTTMQLTLDLTRRNHDKTTIYLDRIQREIDQTRKLLIDLPFFLQLESGLVQPRVERLDLNLLIQAIVDGVPGTMAGDPVPSLRYSLAPQLNSVMADAGLLRRAIGILVENAQTYTPQGGRIRVATIREINETGIWIGVRVHDTGPGIPREEQARIFEPYFRGKRSRSAPGNGLGLSIARRLMDLHCGWIQVESSEGINGGTTFTMWLPATPTRLAASTSRCTPIMTGDHRSR